MFKKALQVTTAFGLLLAGYAVYVQSFALVANQLVTKQHDQTTTLRRGKSKYAQLATELAIQAYGRDHWSTDPTLPIRIYNADKGLWIYAREYQRLKEGKQLILSPFAMIWVSRDGKSMKMATSEVAIIDLDQPLGVVGKPDGSESMKIVHCKLERDVHLRDDKGTADPADDLRILPGPYIEYDEKTLLITGDENAQTEIEDRNLKIIGEGLLIKLRPKEDAEGLVTAGFDGAQSAYLKKKVDLVVTDVGSSGILPGTAQPEQKAGQKTPLHLRSAGDGTLTRPAMQVDLAKPRIAAKVGPPAPPRPTIAKFYRNVEVRRGKLGQIPDQLDCDNLRLTLLQTEKANPPATSTPAKPDESEPTAAEMASSAVVSNAESGPLTEMGLRRAEASGHNVRLTSASQGVKARCKELFYTKLLPESPDETYLRGDATTKLLIEKTDRVPEGPEKGQVTSYTEIRTIDATLFDNGLGNDLATIVARGPGDLESRPAPDKTVTRTAHWMDKLVVQPEIENASSKVAPTGPVTKRITLTGSPGFSDIPTATTLDAKRTLVVWLKPKEPAVGKPPEPKSDQTAKPGLGSESFAIQMLVAIGDVNLKAPGKLLVARDRLDAVFENRPGAAPKVLPVAAKPEIVAEPTVPAQVAPVSPPPAPARPTEPAARARANKIWAKILLTPNAAPSTPGSTPSTGGLLASGHSQQGELDRVFLRGGVDFHQDPAEGKTKGSDVVGEAVDIYNIREDAGQANAKIRVADSASESETKTRFLVFNYNPEAEEEKFQANVKLMGKMSPKALAEAKAKVIAQARASAPLARVENDEMTVRGEVVALDQTINEAWVNGRGSLTQMAARGLLSDKSAPSQDTKPVPGEAKPAPIAPVKRSPLTITFTEGMKFFGKSTDPWNRPVGRAEFYKNVHAVTEDASLECQDIMRTYLDRVVDLARVKRPATNPKANTDAQASKTDTERADIALIECVNKVVVINTKLDPTSKSLLQKQRIEGTHLFYSKASGNFRTTGPGIVYLYDREGQNGSGMNGLGFPNSKPEAGNRPIRPTAGPAPGQRSPTSRGTAVVGRAVGRDPADLKADRSKAKALPPLILTQVKFSDYMVGRFGSGKETDKTERRWADFFGDVEALHAKVANADAVLDPDNRPSDAQFMTSQIMRVVSEPSKTDPDAPPRSFLKAWDNAVAASLDKTISADRITYDSQNAKFFAYGEDGRDVLVTEQQQFGQSGSVIQGTTVMFNAKTGQSQIFDPKSFALLDANSGARPVPVPVGADGKPKLPKRTPFRNLRADKERKDYNGGR